MGGSRCSVGGCNNKRTERISLHQFPKDKNVRAQWIRAIQCTGTNVSRANWNGPSLTKSAQAQLVCSEHFEEECFTLTTRMHWKQGLSYKASLEEDAVPTLFGDRIVDYKNKSSMQPTRGAFRKRELERIIDEYEETPVELILPDATESKAIHTSPDDHSASSEAEVIHTSKDSPEPHTGDNIAVATSAARQEDACAPDACAPETTMEISKDVCKKPETISIGTQVKPATTVKGCQVNRKVQVTNAVKGTQTLLRHTIKMNSTSTQYNDSDYKDSLSVPRDDTPQPAHFSTPLSSKNNLSMFSPLNSSFQSTCTVSNDDRNDPDYLPDDFHSDSDEEAHERHEQVDPVKQRKFLVFEENLLDLFNCCQVCGHKTEAKISQVQGTYVAVRQNCECGFTRRWDSQPKVDGIPAGNILLSAGILFSGCSPTKFLRVFNFINIMCISLCTFFDHQRRILWPAIETRWNCYTSAVMRRLSDSGGRVVVAGDGRADSPGHSAKYGVYSFIDLNSGEVIGLHLVQSNEVKSSYHMELEGLRRAVKALNDAGISIIEIITDRHMQIQKWIRENMPSTVHSFDVWHIAKGVKKKLMAVAREKECQVVNKWIKSITNHLYWSAASSNAGEGDLMESKWKSVAGHIQNIHHGHPGPFKQCQHDVLHNREWLKPGSKAAVKVEDVIHGKHLCSAIRKMSTGYQTSSLESFHSVINHFAPKMTSYSYYGQLCRQHLAALHFNENIKRQPMISHDGEIKVKISFPKYKSGDDYSVKMITADTTFNYVQTLLDTTLKLCGQANTMSTPIPPPLTSGKRKPSKQEAVAKLSSRYKKLKY